jgi:dTDP-4-dehydrorhamnose reductase
MSDAGKRILIIGATGQIGHELVAALAPLGEIVAPTRYELDLSEPLSIRDGLSAVRPGLVVNAAAYTAVDRAESAAAECARINADAPAFLAAECKRRNVALIHFSTDYVFDGSSKRPYVETDATAPLNVYGRTKRAGEEGVAAAEGASLIFRTSWIYGVRGSNFARTMLRLAHEKQTLDVVNDQAGSPTSAISVARGVASVLQSIRANADENWFSAIQPVAGIYHMTAAGATTWYEFAVSVLLDDPRADDQTCRKVTPIRTADYPTPARRPLYSVLDNSKLMSQFGVRLPSWQDGWREVADQLRVSAVRA